jgi:Fe-S oxidoreductase
VASYAPWLANLFTQSPGLRALAKWAAGYSQKRRIPPFALESFTQWFGRRAVHNAGRPRVILWPDTFTNYFDPEVGKAAVEVLEYAGFQVEVPRSNLCCGRPLYDHGMLDTARTLLLKVLDVVGPEIREGVPVLGLEPSCVSVFRDEMTDLLYGNEDACRLKQQTLMLSEFLERKASSYQPPRIHRKAIVQAHCHHQAIMKFTDEQNVLDKAGLDYQVLDSGCCGMAGAFGYEKGDHFEVSMACAERVLLPSVRNAPKETLIIADGFSCREQISQATNRQALHLAQVIQMGMREQTGEVGFR